MSIQRSFMASIYSFGLVAILGSACSGAGSEATTEPAPGLTTSSEPPASGATSPEAIAATDADLMDIDHDNTGGTCKPDCMESCEANGGSATECSSHCKKPCTAAGCNGNNWALCGAGSNSSSPFLCHFMNKVWETTCKNSGVLGAFCAPFGGCSGCRKQMDKNC